MRKLARIAGLAWLGLMAVAGLVLWMVWASPVISNRGLIYVVFAAAFPGALLYRWGRAAHQRPPTTTRERVARAFPAKSAREMGHVMRVKDGPHA